MDKEKIYSTGILIVRIMLGIIFMAHGSQKLFGAFGGSGVSGFARAMTDMGFSMPLFFAWVVGIVEFFGGAFLFLGVVPRVSAALISIIMLVAIFKVHWSNGFFNMNQGFEYQLLILSVCLMIVGCGAGKFSLFNKY